MQYPSLCTCNCLIFRYTASFSISFDRSRYASFEYFQCTMYSILNSHRLNIYHLVLATSTSEFYQIMLSSLILRRKEWFLLYFIVAWMSLLLALLWYIRSMLSLPCVIYLIFTRMNLYIYLSSLNSQEYLHKDNDNLFIYDIIYSFLSCLVQSIALRILNFRQKICTKRTHQSMLQWSIVYALNM
jgi:hypothetical protein